MSDTQATLDGLTLEELQASRRTLYLSKVAGTLTVRYADGTTITYRSLAEIDSALRDLDTRITASLPASSAGVVRAFRLGFGSGYR